ncbi:MAG: UPF0182 family protein [Actinomycetota bacterium]|nr:UPF0182 family protein [Actinomycetota bacterium]
MPDTSPRGRRSRRRTLVFAAVAAVVVLVVVSVVARIYTDVLWFGEVGFSAVFRVVLWTKIGLGVVFGATFAGLILVNIWVTRRITNPERAFTVPKQVSDRYRATIQPYMKQLIVLAASVAGLFIAFGAAAKWREYQLWRHVASFPAVDPVLHKNLGFYVFKLPFLQFVYAWTISTLVAVIVVTVVGHYFLGGIRPQRRGDRVGPEVRAHLSVLTGLLVLAKAWGYRLAEYNVAYSKRGVVNGASYADIHAQLPMLRVLVVVAVAVAVVLFANAWLRKWSLPAAAIGCLVFASVAGAGLYPAVVQKLKVKPNERSLEQPYIKRNIDATRAAFGIGAVRKLPFAAGETIDRRSLDASAAMLRNIRLWSPDVLQRVYLNLQRIKQYYTFRSPADVDRYETADGVRQLMLAAREVSPNGLSPDARTWVNTHLFYTHGYAAVASSAGGIAVQGHPDFLLKNVPASGTPDITTPQLYFGEGDDVSFVVANTKQAELDRPTAEGPSAAGYATSHYDGTGGVPLDSMWRRAAFAIRFRDLNLLISSALTRDSRLMFRRSVLNRVAQLAPFLKIDPDPYIAIAGGRLVWILDGYTTTDRYPYSSPVDFGAATNGTLAGSGNYIRNAVKFVVDAKNGTVDAFVWDEQDPLLRAWRAIFPGIFKPGSAMPPEIRAHVRYPQGLFQVQSDRYANYHVTDPGALYQKEDAWLVGRDATYCLNNSARACSAPPIRPYYVLADLPATAGTQFVIARPFTPAGAGRQNMVSYFVARGDADGYGTLTEYEFPRSQQVFGPEQVEANMNQDPAVSQQVSLWNQQHSRVIYGDLITVPIAGTLLHVQPLFLQGEGSQIPELKRVIVDVGGKVVMADTLADALKLLLDRT